MLEEGVSDHRHKRMTVKALPGSPLEVVETEFFFQLLMSLLAVRRRGGWVVLRTPEQSAQTILAVGRAEIGDRALVDTMGTGDLVNARVALVTAQRDRVVASYTVLAAVGGLSPQILALKIQVYDPMTHYQQVFDAWGGVRIPDGK